MHLYEFNFFNGDGYTTFLEVASSYDEAVLKYKDYIAKNNDYDYDCNWDLEGCAIIEIRSVNGYKIILEKLEV